MLWTEGVFKNPAMFCLIISDVGYRLVRLRYKNASAVILYVRIFTNLRMEVSHCSHVSHLFLDHPVFDT